MEFEIEEFGHAERLLADAAEVAHGNRAPDWCADRLGGEHSGVWSSQGDHALMPDWIDRHS